MNQHLPNRPGLHRREFLKSSAVLLGAAGLAGLSQGCQTRQAGAGRSAPRAGTALNDIILFQGDSITDAGAAGRMRARQTIKPRWVPDTPG